MAQPAQPPPTAHLDGLPTDPFGDSTLWPCTEVDSHTRYGSPNIKQQTELLKSITQERAVVENLADRVGALVGMVDSTLGLLMQAQGAPSDMAGSEQMSILPPLTRLPEAPFEDPKLWPQPLPSPELGQDVHMNAARQETLMKYILHNHGTLLAAHQKCRAADAKFVRALGLSKSWQSDDDEDEEEDLASKGLEVSPALPSGLPQHECAAIERHGTISKYLEEIFKTSNAVEDDMIGLQENLDWLTSTLALSQR